MITRLSPEPELAQLWLEIFFNTQHVVTKVSDASVVMGVARGNAKLAQKSLVETARQEAHLFPDEAHGSLLDGVAALSSLPGKRLGALAATVAVRLVADPGTTYLAGLTFTGPHNKTFELQDSVTVGPYGFGFGRCQALEAGTQTNVDALTLTRISQAPTGHQYCINDLPAAGGRDAEEDDSLRRRVRDAISLYARGTLALYTGLMQLVNPNVLRVLHHGTDRTGHTTWGVLSQNGGTFTQRELGQLLDAVRPWLSASELRPDGLGGTGVRLVNASFYPVDVSLRCQLDAGADPDQVRAEVAHRCQALLDYRYWSLGQAVEWDNLLQAAKSAPGMRYVPDQYFYPRRDLSVPRTQLPRLRGFLLLDMSGRPLVNAAQTLVPYYYPTVADFSELQAILPTI